jgi:hypothetical protein
MQSSELFAVPDWLEWWWGQMVPFTAALYWPAWSAVLSGGALAWAIYLANRGNRDSRRKDAVFLMAVRHLLGEVWSATHKFGEDVGSYAKAAGATEEDARDQRKQKAWIEASANVVRETWEEDKTLENIAAIKLSDFPSVHSFMLFSTARVTIEIIRMHLDDVKEQPKIIDTIESEAKELREYMQALQRQARSLHPITQDPEFMHLGFTDQSLKSLPRWFLATWIGRPFAVLFGRASTGE